MSALGYIVRILCSPIPSLDTRLLQSLYLVRCQHLVGDLPALGEGDGVLALPRVGLVLLETVVEELF